jgi:competence ComEA-like helix-hairpin-helix protein
MKSIISISFLSKFAVTMAAAFFMFFSVIAFALPVNVNKANAELIADSLAGIGMKTAEKIVDYRKTQGPFKKVEDLLLIRGIGVKKLEKIRVDIKLKD